MSTINLGFNSNGDLLTPISNIRMSEQRINDKWPETTNIIEIEYGEVTRMAMPIKLIDGVVVSGQTSAEGTSISYKDFWSVASFPKRCEMRTLAKQMLNAAQPDATLEMVYEQTLTDEVIDLTDPAQVQYMQYVVGLVESAGVITSQQATDWLDFKKFG